MPTINNETVIGSGYVTYRNARPQLLSNGWIVAAVYSSSATRLQFRVKKTAAGAWEDLAFLTTSNVLSWSLQVKGTRVFATLHTSSSNATSFLNFDATTVSSSTTLSASAIDNTSSSGAFSGEDLAINDAGTELHHAFSAKTSTYPNSFNIRYLKGTIATDGSVTWGAVQQRTISNSTTDEWSDPGIALDADGVPLISVLYKNGSTYSLVSLGKGSSTPVISGNYSLVVNASPYLQGKAVILFIPRILNGLANGRLWVAWHGKDATDNAKFNIRTSYSDDGGVTWSTPVKQTTGNTYDQMNASLTADSQGKVLLTWDAQNATTTQTALKVFNGTWGATTALTGDGYTNVSTLFDNTFKLSMTTPPLIRQSTSGVYFSGNYFTGASVAPASGALGDKTTSSVLSYTVTPESGSTVTSIVEKVNGTTVNTYSNPASLSRTFTIPLTNWDALKYYNTHTISVTVTDSNGMANTQTYTFNKALANDASLLEGAKAAKDGKDRISTKRDGIAGQVGLPPGSTFDAISAALSGGNLMKMVTGTVTADSTSSNKITVNNLAFQPKIIVWFRESFSGMGVYVAPSLSTSTDNRYVAIASTSANNNSSFGPSSEAVITPNGFTISTYVGASIPVKYIVLG